MIIYPVYRCVRFSALMLFTLMSMQTVAKEAHAETQTADLGIREQGVLTVQLSSFHELRGAYKTYGDESVTVKIRSKMSGAYDVEIRFLLNDGELKAQLDLVNESMVLDGQNYILDASEKQALAAGSQALSQYIQTEYDDEFPEHSLATVQMLAYWSKAPDGFAIGRREIEAR